MTKIAAVVGLVNVFIALNNSDIHSALGWTAWTITCIGRSFEDYIDENK